MPNISSRPLEDDVTETVVPGHTRTSPPRPRRKTAESDPAVTDDPVAILRPANITAPELPTDPAMLGCTPRLKAEAAAGVVSLGARRRIVNVLPADSVV